MITNIKFGLLCISIVIFNFSFTIEKVNYCEKLGQLTKKYKIKIYGGDPAKPTNYEFDFDPMSNIEFIGILDGEEQDPTNHLIGRENSNYSVQFQYLRSNHFNIIYCNYTLHTGTEIRLKDTREDKSSKNYRVFGMELRYVGH